ncbi:hypothetical protein [Rhodococcus daqingensis]|uniref:Uncharacterized protein n=1 Tax=Rhodococcus daqingensis TaxID=2479363 RepID=A0ABW2RWN1_9NOCA
MLSVLPVELHAGNPLSFPLLLDPPLAKGDGDPDSRGSLTQGAGAFGGDLVIEQTASGAVEVYEEAFVGQSKGCTLVELGHPDILDHLQGELDRLVVGAQNSHWK